MKRGRRQEFVIGGWAPSDKMGRPFSSLLLGTIENGKLACRGKVGAGYSGEMLDRLAALLDAAARSSPFAEVPRPIARRARWVEPAMSPGSASPR